MPDQVLRVQHLSVVIEGQLLLDDVSFALDRGDALAVIGPNGAGKSILLRALVGTVPHSGTVDFAPDVRLGYVPQSVQADRSLPLSTEDLLRAKVRTLRLDRSSMAAVAALVGLSPAALHRPIGQLSGGQLQKALIGFALLGDPNLVLFDEATVSLDRASQTRVFELVRDLQQRLGLTTVIVSHDLDLVRHFANQVLCLNRQRVCFGAPLQMLSPPVLEHLYGTPHHPEERNHAPLS